MTDKQNDPVPTPTKLEVLAESLAGLHLAVNTLGERLNLLEKQGISPVLDMEETKDAKTIMADNLKIELEKQLNVCKGKVKSILFRAKFVEKKGLKITGEIDMKNAADNKEKERIGGQFSNAITANKSCISTLTARGIWAAVRGKDPEYSEYRARVSIAIR